jgi:hypothetical protein
MNALLHLIYGDRRPVKDSKLAADVAKAIEQVNKRLK